jgi:cytochrome c-type biogenesis protein CcmH/NrfG
LLAGLFLRVWGSRQTRRILVGVVGVLVAALAVMSYRQTLLWQNNERFLRYVLASLPADPKGDRFRVSVHLRLAGYYLDRGESDRSAEAARDAIRIGPLNAAAHHLLGAALMQAGDLEAAKASLANAARLNPSLITAFNDLGVAYAMKGNFNQAAEQFRAVLKYEPNNTNAPQNLSRTISLLSAGTDSIPSPKP